jgi:protoporphyrinogen IX oxidase
LGALSGKTVYPHNPPYNDIIIFSFFLFYRRERVTILRGNAVDIYLLVKSLHVISVIAWMAGLFYLPRLYVYHTEADAVKGETAELFQMMEYRLLRYIMNPAMIGTWVFGLWLVFIPGIIDWGLVWPYLKATGVVGMTFFHSWLGLQRKALAGGSCSVTGKQFRLMNEVPTLLMIVIVVNVIMKPW